MTLELPSVGCPLVVISVAPSSGGSVTCLVVPKLPLRERIRICVPVSSPPPLVRELLVPSACPRLMRPRIEPVVPVQGLGLPPVCPRAVRPDQLVRLLDPVRLDPSDRFEQNDPLVLLGKGPVGHLAPLRSAHYHLPQHRS